MSAGGNEKKVFGLPYRQGVGVLCGLGLLCAYLVYSNLFEGPPGAGPNSSPTANAPAGGIPMPGSTTATQTGTRRTTGSRGRSEEFHPVLHPKRAEDRVNPNEVDPTLRLDLLAKVQNVDLAGGQRNLFQLGAPKPVEKAQLPAGKEPVIKPIGPMPPPPPAPTPQVVTPPPTPIPLKFFGFSTMVNHGKTTAYFLDGEDNILIATEGETLKRRYRVVRINAKSVLMEDTESKRQQSIPLTEETQG